MYEPLKNLRIMQERKANTQLAQTTKPRDQEILRAYELISFDIKAMISKQLNKELRRYFEFHYHLRVPNPTIHTEFICCFCSLAIIVKEGDYVIKMSTTEASFQSGTGINSTELIRTAFKRTMEGNTKLSIENCFELEHIGNPYQYFKKKEEQSNVSYCFRCHEDPITKFEE